MLTDPRQALAEQSSFVSYLVGLAGLARLVHALAADGNRRADPPREADDAVYLLLGLASTAEVIERLADRPPVQTAAQGPPLLVSETNNRWLR